MIKSVICAASFVALSGIAQASPVLPGEVGLTVGGNWEFFAFEQAVADGQWLYNSGAATPVVFTFSLIESALLQVTDAYSWGDMFSIFSVGSAPGEQTQIGSTGTVALPDQPGDKVLVDGKRQTVPFYGGGGANGLEASQEQYSAAFEDALFSSWSTRLEPGEYRITGFVVQQDTPGQGAIRLSAVPLPGAFSLMLGTGAMFGTLTFCRRRRAATYKG